MEYIKIKKTISTLFLATALFAGTATAQTNINEPVVSAAGVKICLYFGPFKICIEPS